jgi:hypothetical protein
VPSVGPIRFWLAFVFLNAVVGLRFPEHASWASALMPSLDVVALFLVLALCGAWGKRLPRGVSWALLVFFLAARSLRIADGVERGAYLREFVLSVDLPLLPEFVRLFYATLSLPLFALACLGLALLLGSLGFAIWRAFAVAQEELTLPTTTRALCVFLGYLALLAAFLPVQAVFQPSMLGRWAREAQRALDLPADRARQQARIAALDRALQARPHDLGQLRGHNVYLFLVESYGQSVLDRPELFALVAPEYRRFEGTLSGAGFSVATRLLDSPTYGGRSWLAQATLLTGIPTRDQLQFELLRAAQPRGLAQVFAAAGYRTVLVQPGTVRASTQPDLLHFEQRYAASDLGYRGPRFGWATMPDQFVLDAVRRRELSAPARPLFLGYALVSSHVRWSDLPPLVDDWSTLADGSLFATLPKTHYATNWLSLSGARAAYADAIAYDLEVLRRYLLEFVRDDSLVLILGDHQPHSDVTGQSPSPGVPVHVLSRNPAFIAPFRARGYTPGMVADEALPHPGLESLLPDLVADFSRGPAGSAR